jgi:hypothetical protein
MKPCLFAPGYVGIVVNRLAIDSSPACSVRIGWQAGAAAAAPASGNAARIPGYALARRKNPSFSSGTLWIWIGMKPAPAREQESKTAQTAPFFNLKACACICLHRPLMEY